MRFYQVHIRVDNGSSGGFEYFTTKAEAEQFVRKCKANDPDETPDLHIIEVKPTKAGILSALNIYAAHADNG